MQTRWSNNSLNGYSEYPRPAFQRKNWINLNGLWDYAIIDSSQIPIKYDGKILVPFPVESKLSLVQKPLNPNQCLWYKRIIDLKYKSNSRYLLHFGALDYKAIIYLNNQEVGSHIGGYQSFFVDITKYLVSGKNELAIKVYDPTDSDNNPHGKQSLSPGNIYYTPTSGIWQTVWMEEIKEKSIASIKVTPNIDERNIDISIKLDGITSQDGVNLDIAVSGSNKPIAKKTLPLKDGQSSYNIKISIPEPRLWSPDDPFLYDLRLVLKDKNSEWDNVTSYFGMRKVNIQKDAKGMDRIFLNNKYTYNLGVLDQGFWPDGLYTAPCDAALAYDIKAIKSMGFNTIRKHIKIEPERWYYYADKLGVLVWQDFVNPPHHLPEGSKEIFRTEIQQIIDQLYNHPSIVIWVLFNEGWGAFNQKELTAWIKKYDTTRLVNGHSGEMLYTNNQLRNLPLKPWENSDIVDIHSYPFPRIPPSIPDKAKVIGEYGGIGVSVNGHEWNDMQGWGYIQVSANNLKENYSKMIDSLKILEENGLSGSIYTQPFDVEDEENGLITYDREIIKIPLDSIKLINKKLVATNNYIEPTFFVAKNIDTTDDDSKYSYLLLSYKKGNIDSSQLRRLLLISSKLNKQEKVIEMGSDYLRQLTDPFSPENIKFMSFITKTSQDTGFKFFLQNSRKIDSIAGENTSRNIVRKIINNESLPPYILDTTKKYNWDSLQQTIVSKYGNIGEEAVLGRRLIEYSGYLGNPPDWQKFSEFYVLYFKKALKHPDFNINNLSWTLFQHENDPEILNFALQVIKYSIDNWDRSPETYDTYANLLHKTRQTKQAIEWETKALNMLKGTIHEKEFAETLQKMKDNKPTWPQN